MDTSFQITRSGSQSLTTYLKFLFHHANASFIHLEWDLVCGNEICGNPIKEQNHYSSWSHTSSSFIAIKQMVTSMLGERKFYCWCHWHKNKSVFVSLFSKSTIALQAFWCSIYWGKRFVVSHQRSKSTLVLPTLYTAWGWPKHRPVSYVLSPQSGLVLSTIFFGPNFVTCKVMWAILGPDVLEEKV
jgi:hypothetical protein